MTAHQYDCIIAGGGLSGLLLAWNLRRLCPQLKLCVLEARPAYSHDRYWSLWLEHGKEFALSDIIKFRYDSWCVNHQSSHSCKGTKYTYAVIASGAFYCFMQQSLADAILFGQTVTHISSTEVGTESEEIFHADIVIDARPPLNSQAIIYQQFSGSVVTLDTPLFDIETMTLMDFTIPQPDNAAAFLYILPFSNNQALVEPTLLIQNPYSQQQLEEWSATILHSKGIYPVATMHYEQGCLPLGIKLPSFPSKTYAYPIGIGAGWMRPATGYSFLQSYDAANELATYICKNGKVPDNVVGGYSSLYNIMDKIFLKVAQKHPALLPEIFAHWFKQIDSDCMASFMNGKATLGEIGKLISATKYKSKFMINALCHQ
jgi:lycopene beta-cyclase